MKWQSAGETRIVYSVICNLSESVVCHECFIAISSMGWFLDKTQREYLSKNTDDWFLLFAVHYLQITMKHRWNDKMSAKLKLVYRVLFVIFANLFFIASVSSPFRPWSGFWMKLWREYLLKNTDDRLALHFHQTERWIIYTCFIF